MGALLSAGRSAAGSALGAALDAACAAADAAGSWRWRLAAPFFLRWGDPLGWGEGALPLQPPALGFSLCSVEAPGGEADRLAAAFVYRASALPSAADWLRAAAAARLPAPPLHVLHFWGGGGAALSVEVDPAAGLVRLLGADGPCASGPPPSLTGFAPGFLLRRALDLAGRPPPRRPRPPPE